MSTRASRLADPALTARVAASRAAQGLPPSITDPVILDRVAAIFLAADKRPARPVRARNEAARLSRRIALLGSDGQVAD